jgi:hypothetical protein
LECSEKRDDIFSPSIVEDHSAVCLRAAGSSAGQLETTARTEHIVLLALPAAKVATAVDRHSQWPTTANLQGVEIGGAGVI